MTGRLASTPAQACHCIKSSAASNHKCCHKLPIPDSDTSGDRKNGTPSLPQLTSFKVIAPVAVAQSVTWSTLASPAPSQFAPPAVREIALQRSSPPNSATQQLSSSHLGRSPPL